MSEIERGAEIGGDLGAVIALGPDLSRREWAKVLGLSLGAVDRLRHAADAVAMQRAEGVELEDVVRDAYVRLMFGDIEGAGVVLRAAL